MIVLLLGAVFIVISLANKLIITLTATPEYYEAWKYISLLTFGSLVFALSAFVGANFLATKESKYFLYSSIGGAVVAVITNMILIPAFGIYGASMAIILSSYSMLCLRLYYVSKHIKLRNMAQLFFTLFILLTLSFSVLYHSHWMYVIVIVEVCMIAFINRDVLANIRKLSLIVKRR